MRKLYHWGALLVLVLCSTPSLAQKTTKVANHFFDELFNPAIYDKLAWRNIGPFRGGRSVAATGVPGQPLVYYMGSTGGGVWKTEDAGLSWSNLSDGYFYSGSIGAITVSEADHNIIYVGTGEHTVRGVMSSAGNGVYKSYDAGHSWVYLGLPKSQHIASIVVHPEDPDIVYVAVQGALYRDAEERGIFKSVDGGMNWRKVLFVNGSTGASDLSIDYHNPRVLYASMWDHQRRPWQIRSGGKGSAIYKSVDHGENWTKVGGGLPRNMGKSGISVSRSKSGLIFANVEAENGGVFRSEDGGKTWQQTTSDRETIARAWYYCKIEADPVDPETVYVLNASMLKSIDGGRTFQNIEVPHEDQHALWINPQQPQNMILANDGGACISFNGGKTWSTQQNQPTGQFYRVITDNQFPYRIYTAQQDNSTLSISSRTGSPGIGEDDWYPVAGCESAFLALDPDDPGLIYGGCYLGMISTFKSTTRTEKNIMAYPEVGFAAEPKNLRYRFNWNAPIVVSPHNPTVVYHAANVVLRTENQGLNWKVVSPDLTRNDTTKQFQGGGPFTNEGAGAEIYNTISYLQCSPHDPKTIWVGSDDGLVHITRNEGRSWQNITPPDLGEALINCIEVSPHRVGGAYVVATRYKFGDPTPLIYRTDDYGKHWALITTGIAPAHFARVVREDPKRPGLLYAGTENGFYLTYNNGRKWHRFLLNLPLCPITDLSVHDNDLIASTSGRGIWVLDDISALQNSFGNLLGTTAQLYPPKPAIRFKTADAGKEHSEMGQNPLPGMIIDYYLAENLDSGRLELQILDTEGAIVRRYANEADPIYEAYQGVPELASVLPSQKGVNRFNWDLRRESIPGVPGVFLPGGYQGGMVAPGSYKIRLYLPHDTLEQEVTLLPDPRFGFDANAFAQQQEVLQNIEETIADMHGAVSTMRKIKEQIQQLKGSLAQLEGTRHLIEKGEFVCDAIDKWEANLIQVKQKTSQDVINYRNRLSTAFLILHGLVDGDDPQVTQGTKDRLKDLLQEWKNYRHEMEQIVRVEVGEYNKLFREKQIPAVIVPDLGDDKP